MLKISYHRNFIYAAWLIAVISTLGSLYFSEVRGYVPCELCWYQRILMYPLSVILGIAAYHRDLKVKKYALPLSIVGGSISLYHYLIQKISSLAPVTPCASGAPCNAQYINWFGFITIPFLALVGFFTITVILLMVKSKNSGTTQKDE